MTIDALADLSADALLASCLESWNDRFGVIPAEFLPAVTAYITDIETALRDVFDGLDVNELRQAAAAAGPDGAAAVDGFVRSHLGLLDQWFAAFDTLDGLLRDDAGVRPPWAEPVAQSIALDLYEADSALKSAVISYHHGGPGLRLNPAYGHVYALSNGTASPFGQ
jgi:hypothetical protein